MLDSLTPIKAQWRILILLLLSLSPLCSFQTQAESEFSCMLWDTQPFEKLYYRNGEKMVELELISDRRSEVYELANPGIFQLYTAVPGADGEPQMKLVGRAKFPPKLKRVLFIIKHMPKQDGKGLPLTVLGVNDSLNVFPAGSFRVVNFTGESLSVSIDDVDQDIKPKQFKVIKPDLPAKGGLVSLVVNDNEGKPVFGRRLFGQPRGRQMVFVVSSGTNDGRLRAKLLPDIVPVED